MENSRLRNWSSVETSPLASPGGDFVRLFLRVQGTVIVFGGRWGRMAIALFEVSRFSMSPMAIRGQFLGSSLLPGLYREENSMNPIVPEQRTATTSRLTHTAAGNATNLFGLTMPDRNASALHRSSKIRESDSTRAGSTIIV
jgi:hypothetical protein